MNAISECQRGKESKKKIKRSVDTMKRKWLKEAKKWRDEKEEREQEKERNHKTNAFLHTGDNRICYTGRHATVDPLPYLDSSDPQPATPLALPVPAVTPTQPSYSVYPQLPTSTSTFTLPPEKTVRKRSGFKYNLFLSPSESIQNLSDQGPDLDFLPMIAMPNPNGQDGDPPVYLYCPWTLDEVKQVVKGIPHPRD